MLGEYVNPLIPKQISPSETFNIMGGGMWMSWLALWFLDGLSKLLSADFLGLLLNGVMLETFIWMFADSLAPPNLKTVEGIAVC